MAVVGFRLAARALCFTFACHYEDASLIHGNSAVAIGHAVRSKIFVERHGWHA
jgi:hypothetical protein